MNVTLTFILKIKIELILRKSNFIQMKILIDVSIILN